MSEIERAWVGAFLEADGCAFARRMQKDNYHDSCRTRIGLSISQKIIEPIATVLRLTGTGIVQRNQFTGMWAWSALRENDAIDIAEQCSPYSWKLQNLLEDIKELKNSSASI